MADVDWRERPARARSERFRERWRSPLRGPWLTSVFGLALLVGVPIEFVTGLLSYAAYNPKIGSNDPNRAHGALGFYLFTWGPDPTWAYHLVQGVHVMLGLALVPILLAKLWSVLPKLFTWPAVRSLAHLLERVSIALLVGGAVFQFSTGILNIDYFGAYRFSFYTGHFFGAWVFLAGFVVHVVLKWPAMLRALRSRRLRTELRTGLADTRPEAAGELVPVDPAPATISRRGALALVGGTSLTVIALTAGDTVGGWWRRLSLFGTRNRSPGTGANAFPVNHTAAAAGIDAAATGASWGLELTGTRTVTLSRAQLLAMPQLSADLSITCTEGWSTTQRWTGVPLPNLAALAGVPEASSAVVESLDGVAPVTLAGAQVRSRRSLVALRVNGADLSPDHGYPARIVIPSTPGTYNRKWLRRITFVPQRSHA